MLIKSRKMKWSGHIARMGELRNTNLLAGKPEERRALGELLVDGGVVLKWISDKIGYIGVN
jgi:hypothetical protein